MPDIMRTPNGEGIVEPKKTIKGVDLDRATRQGSIVTGGTETWIELSERLGLALYERQPQENDTDWYVWTKYRSHYPLKMPTWTELSKECGMTVAKVVKIATAWNFQARMVAWAKACDDATESDRLVAIKEMNARQLSMSQRLQEKVSEAIDYVDPTALSPKDLASLMKLSIDYERLIASQKQEKVGASSQVVAQNGSGGAGKANNIAEIISILGSAGMLEAVQGPNAVGVKQTTEVVVQGDGVTE